MKQIHASASIPEALIINADGKQFLAIQVAIGRRMKAIGKVRLGIATELRTRESSLIIFSETEGYPMVFDRLCFEARSPVFRREFHWSHFLDSARQTRSEVLDRLGFLFPGFDKSLLSRTFGEHVTHHCHPSLQAHEDSKMPAPLQYDGKTTVSGRKCELSPKICSLTTR